jgi:hypothetical protein
MTKNDKFLTKCECGKSYIGYPNIYGKICTECGNYIPPEKEPEFVKENKIKMQSIKNTIREMLRNKWKVL